MYGIQNRLKTVQAVNRELGNLDYYVKKKKK